MLNANLKSLTELKKLFNSVDYAHGYTIFDIGGNNYRLIASIHYNRQICYIRTIWSHADFKKPQNDKEYSLLENILDELIDLVRDDEAHPLAEVMQIIGENLKQYDNEHFPEIGADVSDIKLVTFLMKSHGLKQVDLADIFGGQANVSRFLNGERELSKSQILGLKNRFKISADFFLK